METELNNIDNENYNDINVNKKVESEIENIIIFCSCPFTNVILLFLLSFILYIFLFLSQIII